MVPGPTIYPCKVHTCSDKLYPVRTMQALGAKTLLGSENTKQDCGDNIRLPDLQNNTTSTTTPTTAQATRQHADQNTAHSAIERQWSGG